MKKNNGFTIERYSVKSETEDSESCRGFTLIELLIVIVILSILAGILVVIIDPSKKQNMAGDATIKSTINKIVLATSGYNSSYGRVPNESEFIFGLKETTTQLNGTSCQVSVSPDYTCLFLVDAIKLSSDCDSSNWTGTTTDTSDCYIRYYAGTSLPQNTATQKLQYRIYAKSRGIANTLFVYDNLDGGKILHCPYDTTDSSDLSECTSI